MTRLARTLGVVLVSGCAALATAPAAHATPGPANAPEYWFDSWKVPQLWQSGARGQGIVIGEIDTGVNAHLPQLRGKILKGHDFGTDGGDGRVDRDVDEFGHGTAMASIMVGSEGPFGITGLAPAAKILPVAVPLIGTTDAGPDDQLPVAIRWAVDHGANVINMSLGGKRIPGQDSHSCPPDEQDAVDYALRKGVILVAAIGNSGPSRNTIEEPAVCLGVLSVGAVDETGTVAAFSSREPYLTMSAPGVNVPSLGRVAGQGYSGDGSSQAAAIVSAVAALTWSKHRSLPARQIVTRLLDTLDDRRSTPSPAYGYGIVDGYRAVTATVPANAPNPVYAAVEPFLVRDRELSARLPAPHAVHRGQLGDGGYAVTGPSRFTQPGVLGGAALSLAGLVAFIALLVGAQRRRRAANAVPVFSGPADVLATQADRPHAHPYPHPYPHPHPHPYPHPHPVPGPEAPDG